MMALMPGRRNKTTNSFHRLPDRPYLVVAPFGHSVGHTDPAIFPFRLPTLHTPFHLPAARPRENASLSQTRSTTRLDDQRVADSLCRVHRVVPHAGRRLNRTYWHPSFRLSKKTRVRGKVPSFANRWRALVQGTCRDEFNELLLFSNMCCCCFAPYINGCIFSFYKV